MMTASRLTQKYKNIFEKKKESEFFFLGAMKNIAYALCPQSFTLLVFVST